MAKDTVTTIRADEINHQHEDAPQLIAMIYQSELSESIQAATGVESVKIDTGFSGVTMALVMSFVAVVTVSRRKQ